MAAGGRRRSQRMRAGGKMAGAIGADLMKPRGGIRDGIRGIVKPAAAESAVNPSSAQSAEEAWIYVRGCRIERAGLRFDSQGEVYVPDSEDEDEALQVSANGAAGVDLVPAVAVYGAAGVDLTPAVAADGATRVNLAPAVTADGASSVEMKPEVAARLAKKVLGEDLHPQVAALLAEVLSKMDPFYHECFIDMYKFMALISTLKIEVKIILFMWSIKDGISILLMGLMNNKNCSRVGHRCH